MLILFAVSYVLPKDVRPAPHARSGVPAGVWDWAPSRCTSGTALSWDEITLLCRNQLAKLLGEPDEKSFGAADVAELIRVLVLDHVANELRTTIA